MNWVKLNYQRSYVRKVRDPHREAAGVIEGSERAVSLSEPFVQYVTRTLEVRLKEKRRESECGSRHRAPLILSPTRNMMRHEMDEATEKEIGCCGREAGLFQALLRAGKWLQGKMHSGTFLHFYIFDGENRIWTRYGAYGSRVDPPAREY